jgi:hypothetical protein
MGAVAARGGSYGVVCEHSLRDRLNMLVAKPALLILLELYTYRTKSWLLTSLR